MPNPSKAWIVGTDAVLSWFDINAKSPYYSVCDNKGNILFQYTGTDIDEARELLENNLRVAENNEANDICMIKIHQKVAKGGSVDNKTPHIASIHFRPAHLKAYSTQPYQPSYDSSSRLMEEIHSLKSQLNAMQMKMSEEEDEDDEDDEPEENNFLSGIMNNPQIQTMILSALSGIMKPKANVSAVAGVEDVSEDEKIFEAIQILKKHSPTIGDDLLLLCQIAENNPAQFNMLLSMLRK